MASSPLLSILSMTLSLSCLLVAGDVNLMQKACKSSTYLDLCHSTLQSDPKSQQADAKGLVEVVILHANGSATKTAREIAKNVSELGEAGKLCEDHYDAASKSLGASLGDLAAGKFDAAARRASEARESVKTCESDFARLGARYPPLLVQSGELFEHLCDIASSIIINLLV